MLAIGPAALGRADLGQTGEVPTEPIESPQPIESNQSSEIDGSRSEVLALLAGLVPHDDLEADHRRDAMAWVESGAPIFRTAKPATPPKHLVSYCLLVDVEADAVLLVDHRDAQRWLPTGGHVDVDEHPATTARREMAEELGIEPPFHPATGPAPLFVTVTETAGMSTRHTDVSLWFVFAGRAVDEIEPDQREFAGVRWWPIDGIGVDPEIPVEPHLARALAKLGRLGLPW